MLNSKIYYFQNIRQSCWDATNEAFNLVLEKMKTFKGRVELKKRLGLIIIFNIIYFFLLCK